MITIFKRKEVLKQDEKTEYLNLGATKIKKIQKISHNFQKQKSEIKNSLDGFNSGVDTQQTGLMSQ